MWDRWVSGCVEMGLLWNREMGGQGHPSLRTATGQRGQSWLCFLVLSFTAIYHAGQEKKEHVLVGVSGFLKKKKL